MERTTERFKDASEKIRQIESELQDMQCTEVAAMLRSVQNAEREKLQLTISLQARPWLGLRVLAEACNGFVAVAWLCDVQSRCISAL